MVELWGGPECTINRVGDVFRDQTRLTGHYDRPDDLDAFAGLGIRRLRYPVLWENVAPASPADRDWGWCDERLARIRALGMAPIVGLLHHGSGPRYTSLVDDNFVALFADHADAAAARYPWVGDWTPINEPLTTARFSALYGHWHPHARGDRSFWTALLNQVDATRAAMAAIRRHNPAARLIQTEDLGQVYSTPALAPVAEYLNGRRWLTWDLLFGRVGPAHPFWEEIARHGFADRLRAIADDPCPPDVVGINHYLTSDRFLDDREAPLPPVGYHDLNAVRVLDPPPAGLGDLLRQSWQRYGTALAVTESHLGCTREEQLRWLRDGWHACRQLGEEGVDIAGFTAWALVGNVDWTSLLTRDEGHYEPGAFDVRSGTPRPTAIAAMLRGMGCDEPYDHPVLASPAWWQRPARLEHAPYAAHAGLPPPEPRGSRPLLITGATGTLGQAFAGACELRGLRYVLTDRAALPIEDCDRVAAALDRHRPWAAINAAGWVRVDDAETDVASCMSANADGPEVLARACAERGIHLTVFSSDLVFDGNATSYSEAELPNPLNVYGRSKADAEARVLAALPAALVVRTAAFFSPYDEHNFAAAVQRTLEDGRPFLASDRHHVTPTFVPHLVRTVLDLVIDGERGLWHLTNGERLSWHGFADRVARIMDLDNTLIHAAGSQELGWVAARPTSAALSTTRGPIMPSLDLALDAYRAVRRPAERR